MTEKVRGLGPTEIEHLAGTIRKSGVFLVCANESEGIPFVIPLGRTTTDILAEALEEFAKTVTEP